VKVICLADLDGGLLPYSTMRVTSRELCEAGVPGKNLLIVENERSLHQLPEKTMDTVAVLGSGLDVGWTEAAWMLTRQVYYWGDIDTWGLHCLASVRHNSPDVQALMMTLDVFEKFRDYSVPEPSPAESLPSKGLTVSERDLYQRLLVQEKGRLEQEFLPVPFVHQQILAKVVK